MIAPAARSRETTNASGGWAPSSAGEAGRGRRARDLDVVLDQDRDALEGTARAARPARRRRSRPPARRQSGSTVITACSAGFTLRDAVQVMLGQRRRGEPGIGHRLP